MIYQQLKGDFFAQLLVVHRATVPDFSLVPQMPAAYTDIDPPNFEETLQALEQLKVTGQGGIAQF